MRRRALGVVLSCVLTSVLLAAAGSAAQPRGEHSWTRPAGPKAVAGEVIVKFRPGVGGRAVAAVHRRHGTVETYTSPFAGFKLVRVPRGKAVGQMVAALRKEPAVAYAEPNSMCHAHVTPNDELYSYQWHLDDSSEPNPHGGANGGGINVEPAWDGSQGEGVVVAVLDTGVAYEDYGRNPRKPTYTKAPDLAETVFVPGYDFVNDDAHPNDDHSHGTHVTGTIAQSTNNGTGVAGVAFKCSIMPVKVLDRNGLGTAQTVADGIYFAASEGAKVINMSLGWPVDGGVPYDPGLTLRSAVAYAHGVGVTIVCSSGNDGAGAVAYPAAYDEYCMAVGATRYDEMRAPYSNYGESLDIVAPGGDLSVDQNGDGYGDGVLQNTFDPNTMKPNDFGYWFFDGTSMAAPHVSGVAALVIANGVTTPAGVRYVIGSAAEDKGASGWDAEYGHGIVDAAAALEVALPAISIDSVDVAAPADPEGVPGCSKVELVVGITSVLATNPYDPDPSTGGLDLSATFVRPDSTAVTVNGFYDGSTWRVRFAPDAEGVWTFTVAASDGSGTATSGEGTFTCVSSTFPGWARVDGHYLRLSNGEALFAVGHNNGWQYDLERPTFADMAARGENLMSFWMASPWAEPSWSSPEEPYWDDRAPIENASGGLGHYNQAACGYIDGLVERAETAGVYLLPTVWSHGQLRAEGHPWGEGWWYNNAYASLCSATDFFKTTDAGNDTPQWRYQKNVCRYILARWGYSRAIAGWVALCEIEGTTGYVNDKSQAEAWCAAVHGFFQANDKFRVSATGEYPAVATKTDWQSDATTWDTGFDMRAVDSYTQQKNDIGVANAIGTQTESMWISGKPCFHAEFGGEVVPNGASQPTHLHNGIWPGLAAGAAMTPLVWCDGGSWPMLTDPACGDDMRSHLQHLSDFVAGTDYVGDAGLAPAALDIDDSACRGWGMKLADRGFAWIQKTDGAVGGQVLSVHGLTAGHYVIEWYDVWTDGAAPAHTGSATVGADGTLSASIPALTRADIACKFLLEPVGSPPVAADDSAATTEDTPVEIAVLANDSDPDGDPLTVYAVTQGADGSVTNNASSVTYTPLADFSGTDSFTYTVGDGNGNTDTATVTVAVSPANDAPVANDDSATTGEDTPVTIDVLANDSDPDGDALTVSIVTQPSYGTAAVNGDNTVTYTPDPGFAGDDVFDYSASDGAESATATVTVTVLPAGGPNIFGWIHLNGAGGLDGIVVRLNQKAKGWQYVTETLTYDGGYYELGELAAGTYRVVPVSGEYRFSPRSYEVIIETPDDQYLCDFTAK